jgi:hypothetical protein
MNEQQANALAEALGGLTWNSGGGIWLVLKERSDGRLVVISDEVVCEYASQADFESGAKETAAIHLC